MNDRCGGSSAPDVNDTAVNDSAAIKNTTNESARGSMENSSGIYSQKCRSMAGISLPCLASGAKRPHFEMAGRERLKMKATRQPECDFHRACLFASKYSTREQAWPRRR